MMKKFLLKLELEIGRPGRPAQRISLFRTTYKTKDKV
jgi:hypothetical protein